MKNERGMGKKLLEFLNSKPVIGVLIFIMLSLASVFAADVIVQDGALTTESDLNVSNVLFVDVSTGKVGIGTTGPGGELHIADDTAGSNADLFVFQDDNTNTASHARVALRTGGTSGGDPFYYMQVLSGQVISMGIDNSDGDKFKISDSGTLGTNDRLVIDTTGNVGIGTASPNGLFHIASTNPNVIWEDTDSSADNKKWQLDSQSEKFRGFATNDAFTVSGQWLEVDRTGTTINDISFLNGDVGIGTVSPGADPPNTWTAGKILDIVAPATNTDPAITLRGDSLNVGADLWYDESAGDLYIDNKWDNTGGDIRFRTRTEGTAVFAIDIQGSGNILMANVQLEGEDDYACFVASTGELIRSAAACASSSIRYKENIEELAYGLEEVLQLNPVFFKYKKEKDPTDQRRKIGLIAEEVQPIIPEVVYYDGEGLIDSVDYPNMIALLTKAIQELKAENDLMRLELCSKNPTYSWC